MMLDDRRLWHGAISLTELTQSNRDLGRSMDTDAIWPRPTMMIIIIVMNGCPRLLFQKSGRPVYNATRNISFS